jgi:hypothetical protein
VPRIEADDAQASDQLWLAAAEPLQKAKPLLRALELSDNPAVAVSNE